MAVLNVTKNNFEKEVLQAEGKVLIDFWASWCGPCRMIAPMIDEVAEEGVAKVCKINIDEERDLATSFNVMSIPTLVVVENGKVKNTSVGVVDKEKVLELLK